MRRILSALFVTILLTTHLSACGNNKKEPAEPQALPTVTGLPAQPEESDDDDTGETAPAPANREVETQSYPAPTPPGDPTPYPDPTEPLPPTAYPEADS